MVRDKNRATLVCLVVVGGLPCHAKGLSMEGSLWNQPVGERDTKETGDSGGQTEEKKIPVESGRFTKRKLSALRNQRRNCRFLLVCKITVIAYGGSHTIMIKVEQDGQEDGKWDCQKHFSNTNVPQTDKPATVRRREKSLGCRQCLNGDISHMADMHEAREKDNSERRTVILDEFTHISLEKGALTKHAADITGH